MELENIFHIGRLLGICKIWTAKPRESPFFQVMPAPLYALKNILEKLGILNNTIEEMDKVIVKCTEALDLSKEIDSTEKGSENRKKLSQKRKDITDYIRDYFNNHIPIWEDRINNELIKMNVVKLSTDTNLNPEKLSRGAASFFENDIWNELTDLEKEDLDDSCRCISLQAWTPAAMITMRVIESVLRNYYNALTSNNPQGKTWGSMLNELNSNSSANKKLLGYFDYLKDFRNSLQHPEIRFSQFEAEEMYHQAIHILNTFYS